MCGLPALRNLIKLNPSTLDKEEFDYPEGAKIGGSWGLGTRAVCVPVLSKMHCIGLQVVKLSNMILMPTHQSISIHLG